LESAGAVAQWPDVQSTSPAQARHLSLAVVADLSQIGTDPEQCALTEHWTHCPYLKSVGDVSQTGVAPLQSAPLQRRQFGGCVVPSQTGAPGETTMHAPLTFDHSFWTT
jgi:hypothetical protein